MFFNRIRSALSISVQKSYIKEFDININTINVARARITAMAFVGIELLVLVASCIIKGSRMLTTPDLYYTAMYVLFLSVMSVYLFLFSRLRKNVPEHVRTIQAAGLSFTAFALSWCAGISLLDQLSSGQVIVYTVAILAIAVTPFFKPATFLTMYLTIHATFLLLLPYFQKSSGLLFGNIINSTTFLIISWAISYMRYKKLVEDFNYRKTIQEKNDELNRVNKELEEVNQKLETLSRIDSLTGIYNRFMLDRAVKAEWNRCKRNHTPLSVMMIDIDYFKIFNDNYGHQAGDDCIRRVAYALQACTKRSSDTVARYGGDEFSVILPYEEKENALRLAQKMKDTVAELSIPHVYSNVSEKVTISIGVNTIIPSKGDSLEEFIRSADKALYRAKECRNEIVVAEP